MDLKTMFDIAFLKRLVILNGIVPVGILAWDAWRDQLGANRVNYAIHVTGILALVFLVLSLAVTPLRKLTGWNSLIAYRRALGLYGFFYAVIHLLLYITFDRAGNLTSTWSELISRRYLQVGLASLVLMLPLAATSTDYMIRQLGAKRWKLLHRLAYLAIALGGLHYLLLVKSDIRQPAIFLGVIGTLLVSRIGCYYFERKPQAKSLSLVRPAQLKSSPEVKGSLRPKFWKGPLKLAKIFHETDNVKTFRFVEPNGGSMPFDFSPGQYLNLKLSINGAPVARSYTIASSPSRRDYCEVTIKRETKGLASCYIHDTWKEGDLIELGAPAGKFTFTGIDSDEVVLIGGGVGITPVMSMLRYLTDRAWSGPIHFILVMKTESDWIFRDELTFLQRRHPNLQLHLFITRADLAQDTNGQFQFGRLSSSKICSLVPNILAVPVYLCGPDPMMEHTRELLADLGKDPSQIHTEAFTSTSSALSNVLPAAESTTMEPNVSDVGLKLNALTIRDLGRTIEVESCETILEGAERNDIEIPFECRSGICGQCKLRLCEGEIRMEQTYALSPTERQQGWILACQSHIVSDATIAIV
jgi:glycine betaine catabolism B